MRANKYITNFRVEKMLKGCDDVVVVGVVVVRVVGVVVVRVVGVLVVEGGVRVDAGCGSGVRGSSTTDEAPPNSFSSFFTSSTFLLSGVAGGLGK